MAELVLSGKANLALRYYYHTVRGTLDPELKYVDGLLSNRRRFIDIGANVGMYSYFFSRKMATIEAFEPLKEITSRLQKLDPVTVHNVALSDQAGEVEFYIPRVRENLAFELASLEPRITDSEVRTVPVATLDSFQFQDVDLIKIDVEGHEASVIRGAQETLTKNRPVLIIEIEQRHIDLPMYSVFESLEDLGYTGYFLQDYSLTDIRQFTPETHQTPYLENPSSRHYINNFIFMPQ